MIKALFLDLDQTLLDRTQTFQRYLTRQYHDMALRQHGVSESDYYAAVHRWDDNGYRNKLDTFNRAVADVQLPLSGAHLMTHFQSEYGKDARLFDGVAEWLTSMAKEWPLVLITNGRSQGQSKKLAVTGITSVFHSVFISEAEGVKKPDREIYLRACQKLSLTPEQVLFVGDHPQNDVDVPASLGMQAVWVRNDVYDPPQHAVAVVDSVTQINPRDFG